MMTRLVAAALVTLVALAVPAVTRSQAPLGEDPLAPRYFTIDWQLDQKRADRTNISGYVHSQYGQTLGSVRLVVEMLDASQTVVGRRYEWLGRELAPFSRSYFEIGKLPPAASYRVAVNSFSIIQTDSRFF
jgi:hypothetical protein